MKYSIINRGDALSKQLTDEFHQAASQYPLIRNDNQPDVVVSIGGDGTMLQAIHHFRDDLQTIAFVGVHTGHLGFYADWKANEIKALLEMMAHSNLSRQIVKYPTAELQVTSERGTEHYVAINEFTIKGAEATLVAQLNINDEPFEMFRGDGIVISTPTGSTAYNKSLGGAIIHPSLPSIQIAEIASINNRVYRTLGSSMILPKHHHCDLIPKKKQNISISVDHIQRTDTTIQSIRCSVSNETVQFVRFRPFPFWNRVKEAFIKEFE